MAAVRKERGIALAITVLALLVMSALAAAVFGFALQEQRLGLNDLKVQRALAAAEAALRMQLASWNRDLYNRLVVGQSVEFGGGLPRSTGWYRGSVRRVSRRLFLLRAEGFSADSVARQHIGLLAKIEPVRLEVRSPLTVLGDVEIGPYVWIEGTDRSPRDWSCEEPEQALPGIRVLDVADVKFLGCSGLACAGQASVFPDSTLGSRALRALRDIDFQELAASATKVLRPGVYGRVSPSLQGRDCHTADGTNWGAPVDRTSPCSDYFPVIYGAGDLAVAGGAGQGILLVDGNLSVRGGFEFYGVVFVRGALKTEGAGGKFWGAVFTSAGNLGATSLNGFDRVVYSSCAIEHALWAAGPAAQLTERGWANLY